MIRFRCPSCNAKMEVDDAFAGRAARCATCGEALNIPRQSETTPRRPTAPTRPGAATLKVEGEKVEVVPPLEMTAYIAAGSVVAAVLAFFIAIFIGWAADMDAWLMMASVCGAVISAIGAMIGLSAWNTIRRSRGRKRGGKMVLYSMVGGGGLCLVFLVGGIIGGAQYYYGRQPCEKNLEAIYQALQAYAAKHDGDLPAEDPGLKGLVADRDLSNSAWLKCPAIPGSPPYQYVPDMSVNPKYKAAFAPKALLVYDGAPHPDGLVRCLLLDGTQATVAVKDWPKYISDQLRQWQDGQTKFKIMKGEIKPPPPPAPTPTVPSPTEEEEPPAPVVPPSMLPPTPTPKLPLTPTAPKPATATPGAK